ncbi:phenylalanine--tRNA ligase subunit beta [Leifsonia sp. H3M29-4]|uniref:phenylalanine--tRNA ligase subunit beta n=1 Tax=Salinibacterium metalliresistens TaxID=3031321 RepID=UPI0023DBE654|nr:phenylalanine--tRNA ligase subunit beta [Salinibacterium metalliresistens]MDF1479001.1 phenylalanine--tRNA ligase subunit beta [Salinibacterium metalliresistens]
MRIPISWLREFVDVPADVTHEQVHAALVKVGLEEEDVHTFDLTGPVVVGQVLSFDEEPQSNGKTIRWCQVDVGEAEPRGIVCGASNFVVGDKVVVSLPGAVLPGPFPISARKTYGHVSDGMIASARELGLGDEHSGILRLTELGLDPEVGSDAIALLGLDDFAVEVNVTPDRGYAFSIRGIAREYANSTGATFRDPVERITLPATAPSGFSVVVDDAAPIHGRAGCTVFVTRVVRGVDPSRPTPAWMVSRLALAGIRSISLAVDVTNYVMLELGQPTHAYDLDKLTGGITVRRARPGETITTLDDKARTLDPEDLLITDESGPIGIAGVMGGATTEIDSGSTNVLVEAANFDPVSIARSARRHKLPSEASRRFERGVDPRVAPYAAARVVELLVELGGGTADPLGSVLDQAVAVEPIALAEHFVAGLIGVPFSADEITGSLEAIGADVVATDSGWSVTPPSWRPDLTDAPTLAEEVARIVGYDRIPSVLPVAPPGRGLSREQRLRRLTAASLAAAGLTEVLSYPFLPQSSNDLFGSADAGTVPAMRIANPLDAEAAWLRTSLIPGLIAIARRNLSRGLTDLAVYELGEVFLPEAGRAYGSGPLPVGDALPSDEALAALRASIPPQPWHVGALFLGDAVDRAPGRPAVPSGIADALDAARHLASVVAAPLEIRTGMHQALHPGRTAELFTNGVAIGWAGELLPALAAEFDLPRVVAVLELDLDALVAAGARDVAATPIASMPAATQDVSLVVPISVRAGELLALLKQGGGELLEHVTLVDDYRGPGVPDGSKSLTYALRFRAPDRTLTAAEATEAKHAAVALAASEYGAVLRE